MNICMLKNVTVILFMYFWQKSGNGQFFAARLKEDFVRVQVMYNLLNKSLHSQTCSRVQSSFDSVAQTCKMSDLSSTKSRSVTSLNANKDLFLSVAFLFRSSFELIRSKLDRQWGRERRDREEERKRRSNNASLGTPNNH